MNLPPLGASTELISCANGLKFKTEGGKFEEDSCINISFLQLLSHIYSNLFL